MMIACKARSASLDHEIVGICDRLGRHQVLAIARTTPDVSRQGQVKPITDGMKLCAQLNCYSCLTGYPQAEINYVIPGAMLQMFTHVIDDRGEVFVPTPAELRRLLGAGQAPRTVLRYGVLNLGWVAVRRSSASIDIVYHRPRVSHLALIGLIDMIWQHRSALSICESFGAEPSNVERSRAIVDLSNLVEDRKPRSRFWRCPIPIMKSTFGSRLPAAMEVIHSDIPNETRFRLLDAVLDCSYSVNKLDPTTGQYRSVEIGYKIARFDPEYAASRVGQTYHDFIDPGFGCWLAGVFAEMSTRSDAVSEQVATFIACNDGKMTPIEYTRLMMPYHRGHEKFLLVASDFPEV